MGCDFCNEQSPCEGTQATLPQNCQCADPGLQATGSNFIVADTYNCPRRLQPIRDGLSNVVNGFAFCFGNNATPTVAITNQPQCAYPEIAIGAAQSFGSIVVAMGLTGTHYRLTPPAIANLVLQTDALGTMKFAAIPAATVPDPLEVDNLTVADTATVKDLVVESITGPIAAGTIANLLGLDAANHVVKGSVSLISKAFYFESPTRTGTGFPNQNLTSGQNCTIGNQLYDSDGITHITAVDTIVVDVTGGYEITWSGIFGRNTADRATCPGIGLLINGVLVNPGMRDPSAVSGTQKVVKGTSVTITGSHVQALNATDSIKLVVQDATAASNLRDVQLVITKFKSA